ncbi:ferric reductase [Stutzerimonas stutzeri]|uniref:Ferric reductase n=1 Tax=Stutzerimonas stutzeri TaxID=316 RepID=A0A2S4AKR8_STUST|nr:ferric reductase-like transmembrane domain-containing protein [Stutzerimonas stutzeri]MCQ4264757.1 ferric reductase-like transmembrane domain-containing protein [Stutzerimonas stutzeri]POH81979.1 ferric reductase [Stutzerimonas stutzeri]
MRPIKLTYVALFLGLTLLWLLVDSFVMTRYQFWPLRKTLVNYSGVLTMGAMSVAMVLAARPSRFEHFFDGLDKTYRLHKWLGISALVLGTLHWAWAQIPKWLVGFGWLEKPARRGAAQVSEGIAGVLHDFHGIAEDIGEWAFYAAAALLVLALLKRFPYRWFFKTHRWLALVYLALVVHSAVLTPPAYWASPLGLVLGVMMAAGSAAAYISLLRRIGRKHQVVGRIDHLTHHRGNHVLRVDIALDGAWPGHEAGQFAFVTFDENEGPHPFSLSSAWCNDGKLAFSIKGLGDYTRTLPDTLKVGDLVKVEGPYGCFAFHSHKPRQIWIAGGIGIAPFIGRLQALAERGAGSNVDLFYCTSEPDQGFIERVRQLAERAQVHLHMLVASEGERLTPERLRQLAPQWRESDVWFCGPAAFGQALRKDLQHHGLPATDFHQELFSMR